ncbi:hypothetical protein EJB05_26104, partial [Eragrostis curvula]
MAERGGGGGQVGYLFRCRIPSFHRAGEGDGVRRIRRRRASLRRPPQALVSVELSYTRLPPQALVSVELSAAGLSAASPRLRRALLRPSPRRKPSSPSSSPSPVAPPQALVSVELFPSRGFSASPRLRRALPLPSRRQTSSPSSSPPPCRLPVVVPFSADQMDPAALEEEAPLNGDNTNNAAVAAAGNRLQVVVNLKKLFARLCHPLGQLFVSLGDFDGILDGLQRDYNTDNEEEVIEVEDAAAASCDRWWLRIFPLGRHCLVTDTAFGACLETIAGAMVTAVLTLNIYTATYFLAWAKDKSGCMVEPKPDYDLLSATGIPENVKIWLKIAAVALPFAFVPLTICISGMAKAAEKSGHGLGYVAGLVIGEVCYVMMLGGLMTVCMSDKSYKEVGAVILGLLASLLLIWGCVFKYPKVLRSCVYPRCCCPTYEEENLDLEAGGGGRAGGGHAGV